MLRTTELLRIFLVGLLDASRGLGYSFEYCFCAEPAIDTNLAALITRPGLFGFIRVQLYRGYKATVLQVLIRYLGLYRT